MRQDKLTRALQQFSAVETLNSLEVWIYMLGGLRHSTDSEA